MVDFFNLSDYLLKFKKLRVPEKKIRLEIVENIRAMTGISLEENVVKIKNSTVFLEINPLIKNEIFYKKGEIIDFCKKRSGIVITAIK